MNDRERELERFLERARMDAPSAQQLARTRERLLSNITNPPPSPNGHGPSASAPHASAPAASSASAALGLKIVGASMLLGVSTVALRASLASHAPEPERSVPAATVPVETAAPVARPPATANAPPAGDAPPTAVPAVGAPHNTAPVAHKPARSEPQNAAANPAAKIAVDPTHDFARDVALLQAAIEAHRRGDDAEARRKLAEHERLYPNSQLSLERGRLAAELDAKP
jgi:hypothetical protein